MNSHESVSIETLREAVATARNPVMLYSINRDSSVMLYLARKAFHPVVPRFPLRLVDAGWLEIQGDVWLPRSHGGRKRNATHCPQNYPQELAEGVAPIIHGSNHHTDVMKTQTIKQALNKHDFDVVLGGTRRDEEESRAKEHIFSFRAPGHCCKPKLQRSELWRLYNTGIRPEETIRVFPISNWTELDVWEFICNEHIPIVPLYLAAERPVVKRGGQWIMVDDDRFNLLPGERVEVRRVRFRALNCWPTAAIESEADSLYAVIAETINARNFGRPGPLISSDAPEPMKKKRQEFYF